MNKAIILKSYLQENNPAEDNAAHLQIGIHRVVI